MIVPFIDIKDSAKLACCCPPPVRYKVAPSPPLHFNLWGAFLLPQYCEKPKYIQVFDRFSKDQVFPLPVFIHKKLVNLSNIGNRVLTIMRCFDGVGDGIFFHCILSLLTVHNMETQIYTIHFEPPSSSVGRLSGGDFSPYALHTIHWKHLQIKIVH